MPVSSECLCEVRRYFGGGEFLLLGGGSGEFRLLDEMTRVSGLMVEGLRVSFVDPHFVERHLGEVCVGVRYIHRGEDLVAMRFLDGCVDGWWAITSRLYEGLV